MMAPRARDAWLGRLVQVGFLAGLILVWYLATTRWGVNRLLLPNPVAVFHDLVEIQVHGLHHGGRNPHGRAVAPLLYRRFHDRLRCINLVYTLWHQIWDVSTMSIRRDRTLAFLEY